MAGCGSSAFISDINFEIAQNLYNAYGGESIFERYKTARNFKEHRILVNKG